MASCKKRKITDECRVFQEKWTDLYFFVNIKNKPVCLVCNESVSVMKEYNLKRHYDTNVEDYSGNIQMELIDFQCNSDLQEKFKNFGLLEFYSLYVEGDRFPAIRSHALATASLFGSTYICEQLFSRMKNVKSKLRNRISNTHLENSLRISTSDIKANVDRLVNEKQCQVSH